MPERIMVPTGVGRLAVDCQGSGSPVVLWNSLFVDSRSWGRLVPLLPPGRRLVVITGPGHGASGDPGRRYDLAACAVAATEVLRELGIRRPVDWVGNAWGGHVGIRVATSHPEALRSLVTISSPTHPLPPAARAQMRLLLLAHRVVGPARFIVDAVVDAMLAPATRAGDAAAVELLRSCMVDADPRLLRNAVTSISLHREDLAPLLPRLDVPTLMITGADDQGWTPAQMRTATEQVPGARGAVVPEAAYLPPLEQPAAVARLLAEFWTEVDARSPGVRR